MSQTSDKRSQEFLAISDRFKLGALTTEGSHPVTADLSDTSRRNVAEGLRLLFEADADVLRKYRELALSGRLESIAEVVESALRKGGRIFFTGCGSTGRLSIQLVSIWREFWQRMPSASTAATSLPPQLQTRALSVMAGGDFALIKAVEGFEDFTTFGRKQIRDLGVGVNDVVFAITEGGETSFVIGTAWEALDAGAKVYFVYNNPDDILRKHVQRSREILEEPRIEKINLTTGPMAITGSTRMQATTIQLCVLLTVLEIVVRKLTQLPETVSALAPSGQSIPCQFSEFLEEMHQTLLSNELRQQVGQLVLLEERTYKSRHRNNYFADRFGIDLLTDTTERSPTFCIPPFRKFDDRQAAESWAFLFVPAESSPQAWEHLLKREPRCVQWNRQEVQNLVTPDKVERTLEIVGRISGAELMRFRIGVDGLNVRPSRPGDSAVAVVGPGEESQLKDEQGFFRTHLESAAGAGGSVGLICLGYTGQLQAVSQQLKSSHLAIAAALVPVPETGFLLDGITRVGLKMLLNTMSTSVMVRLGRVMGNYMIYVVPSNLKLIDRATRYIRQLTGLEYEAANRLLFEIIEFVEPRMKADLAYPPVVAMAVYRARYGVGNEEAERILSLVPES